MEFMRSPPDVVRSHNQRRLLDYWQSQRGRAALPFWRGLDASEIPIPSDNLACTEVVHEGTNVRFRISFHGAQLVEAFGPVDCVGKFLDEILPPPYLGPALATYRQVVSGKEPVYTGADMRDPGGRIVHHERLLLPFTLGGGETERILALDRGDQPRGPVSASRADEIANPAAGNCALHDDPILEWPFPFASSCRPAFCSIVRSGRPLGGCRCPDAAAVPAPSMRCDSRKWS